MRWKFFTTPGYTDLLAVGPGMSFNPGNPTRAQEMVNLGQVCDRLGSPVAPGTPYTAVDTQLSLGLWTAMAGHAPTTRA